jgi:beta-galactosidase GanA
MVRNDGHNWDLEADDAHKEARGLVSAALEGPEANTLSTSIAWRIQGAAGGETPSDTVRGPSNNGGQYGERMGWHLPGFPDRGWAEARVPDGQALAGTQWYRTTFRLDTPKGHDPSLGLSIGDAGRPRSAARYRVLIFLNGWNLGQFIAHVGPQRTFVLPSGLLDLAGENTLALVVTSDGRPGDALEPVRLVNLRTVRGGVPVARVPAPGYAELFPVARGAAQ